MLLKQHCVTSCYLIIKSNFKSKLNLIFYIFFFTQGIDFMVKNENQNDDWQLKPNITDGTGATPQFDNKYSVFPRTPNNALLEPMLQDMINKDMRFLKN